MGQIQNAINQMLGTATVAAHIGSKALEPYQKLRAATAEATAAREASAYYQTEAGKAQTETQKLIKEGKLEAAQTALEEESGIYDLAAAAEKTEYEAIERERQAKILYGTKKQREAAQANISDYPINLAQTSNPMDRVNSLKKAIEDKRGIVDAASERRAAILANSRPNYPVKEKITYEGGK